jgi:hypothetical protein
MNINNAHKPPWIKTILDSILYNHSGFVGVIIKLRFDICWHARRFTTNKEEFQHSSFKVSFKLVNFLTCCKILGLKYKMCVKLLVTFPSFAHLRNCDIETPNGEDLDINATTQRDFSLFLSLWLWVLLRFCKVHLWLMLLLYFHCWNTK